MIEYAKTYFGINLMNRVHGSAVYKSIIPALLSISIFGLIRFYIREEMFSEEDLFDHPYAIGVLVTSVTFLIAFRANYGYQRYWGAASDIHSFMSKALDATVMCASFHMQCSHYDAIKPGSFFDHPELLNFSVCRKREIGAGVKTINKLVAKDEDGKFISMIRRHSSRPNYDPKLAMKKMNWKSTARLTNETLVAETSNGMSDAAAAVKKMVSDGIDDDDTYLEGTARLDGGWGLLNNDSVKRYGSVHQEQGKHWAKNRTPSVFLQELAHLSSLLIAVSYCTLRDDIEGSKSCLGNYIPGSPWPSVDPDNRTKQELKYIEVKQNWFVKIFRYIFDINRTVAARTAFNASRPMMVLGGVSDAEIKMLQRAKGPSAKTSLCLHWISEFMIREHLAGSMGKVGPPIVSRLFQFLSDGMIFYNHARKVMYIPFPFPHAQICALFNMVMVVAVPLMMEQYADHIFIGAGLSFVTVLCMAAMHEVARELENPYANYPNEIPLATLLAIYNEALVSMCTGYHPDAYWGDSGAKPSSASNGRKSLANKETPKKEKRKEETPQMRTPIKTKEKLSHLEMIVNKQSQQIVEMTRLLESSQFS